MSGVRGAALCAMVLAALCGGAAAEEVPAKPPPQDRPAEALTDPMSLLHGTPDSWSVSRSDAGCFLLSPRRVKSSSLAIGRHPKLGLGLFVVDFGLAVAKANAGEPVAVRAEGQELAKSGRIVGIQLLFVPLEPAEVASSLRELAGSGTLWLEIRHAWIGHAGAKVADAVAQYGKDCGGKP